MLADFRVCHITSVHPRYDSRIFIKECCSLARLGYRVTLIVADGLGDELKEGVQILDVGKPKSRKARMWRTTALVFEKAASLGCDLYHFHDPELLWSGLRLKKLGHRVVYDAHEDVPRQILAKPYIPTVLKYPISWLAEQFENFVARHLDAVVVPTPLIRERFLKVNAQVVEVRNFPIFDEVSSSVPWETREDTACYVGAISQTRGIEEIVSALEYYPVPLELAGNFRPASLRDKVAALPEWEQVREHGFVGREQVQKILSRTKIGLVTLHPTQSYVDAIPIKMFEYMAAGIPFIASDFPFWRQLLEGYECGVFVDPMDSEAIAKAMRTLMEDQERAYNMGLLGKDAVIKIFNWGVEEKRLLNLYEKLLA